MTSPELERLVLIGKLKREPGAPAEIEGPGLCRLALGPLRVRWHGGVGQDSNTASAASSPTVGRTPPPGWLPLPPRKRPGTVVR